MPSTRDAVDSMNNNQFDISEVLGALADLPDEKQVKVIEDVVSKEDLSQVAPVIALVLMDFDLAHTGKNLAQDLAVRMEAVREKVRLAVQTHFPCPEVTERDLLTLDQLQVGSKYIPVFERVAPEGNGFDDKYSIYADCYQYLGNGNFATERGESVECFYDPEGDRTVKCEAAKAFLSFGLNA